MTGILLSGGMDSIAILYWKRPQVALTINYGQNSAQSEIEAATYVCEQLNIEHHIINIDCSVLGSGDMSNEKSHKIAPQTDWWPFRNQLLLTFAAMYLIRFDVNTIMIGSIKPDEQFKDGTAEFTDLMSSLTSYQEGEISIEAPAIEMSSIELIQKSKVPLSLLLSAHSCHTGNIACGVCRGCRKYLSIIDQLEEQ